MLYMSRRFSPKTRLDHHKGKQSRLNQGMNHPALLSCRVFRRKSERLSLFGSKQFRLNPRAISPPVTELRPLSIESESVVILRRNTELNLLSYKTARWVALHRKKKKKDDERGRKKVSLPVYRLDSDFSNNTRKPPLEQSLSLSFSPLPWTIKDKEIRLATKRRPLKARRGGKESKGRK